MLRLLCKYESSSDRFLSRSATEVALGSIQLSRLKKTGTEQILKPELRILNSNP